MSRTRADAIVVSWTDLSGTGRRIVFEPGESARWARVEQRWDCGVGHWVHVGTEPVRDVHVEAPEREVETR